MEGKETKIYVLVRPGVEEFLRRTSELFELVLYTASISKYATPILDKIDPDNLITHRLFREHCEISKDFFVKNLSRLGRNLKDVIIIDNMPLSYSLQPYNGIPVNTWISNKQDTQLKELIPILELLVKVEDVRIALKKIVKKGKVDYRNAVEILKSDAKDLLDNKNGTPKIVHSRIKSQPPIREDLAFENSKDSIENEAEFELSLKRVDAKRKAKPSEEKPCTTPIRLAFSSNSKPAIEVPCDFELSNSLNISKIVKAKQEKELDKNISQGTSISSKTFKPNIIHTPSAKHYQTNSQYKPRNSGTLMELSNPHEVYSTPMKTVQLEGRKYEAISKQLQADYVYKRSTFDSPKGSYISSLNSGPLNRYSNNKVTPVYTHQRSNTIISYNHEGLVNQRIELNAIKSNDYNGNFNMKRTSRTPRDSSAPQAMETKVFSEVTSSTRPYGVYPSRKSSNRWSIVGLY